MVMAFLGNASPYVTAQQAKSMPGENLHLAGDLMKETLFVDVRRQEVRFTLRDEKGDVVPVVFEGSPPANMGSATKIVAVGGFSEGRFEARRLLLKCPSKYKSEADSGRA